MHNKKDCKHLQKKRKEIFTSAFATFIDLNGLLDFQKIMFVTSFFFFFFVAQLSTLIRMIAVSFMNDSIWFFY